MKYNLLKKKRVLTGDRPTGPLHIGHYSGSLKTRIALQDKYTQFIIIADIQALADNIIDPIKIHNAINEIMLDYLAVGIDPVKNIIFIQSMIPQISELTILYLNLVNISRIARNPTIKSEIQQKRFEKSIPAGFFIYPISQVADITIFDANIVPVGIDQVPMIEQACEIVDTFNNIYGKNTLIRPKALLAKNGNRLPGIDGYHKMSKSLKNGIYLSDSPDKIVKKIKSMYTDPNHLHISDPGKVDGNLVFTYLDQFGTDKKKISKMKAHYIQGGLGDMTIKKYLIEVMQDFLSPIRIKRKQLSKDKKYIQDILKIGSEQAQEEAGKTLKRIKHAMNIDYF